MTSYAGVALTTNPKTSPLGFGEVDSIMAKAKASSKGNPSTNGETKRTGISAVASKSDSNSALQKSAERVSNANNGDVPLPSRATETGVYPSVSEEQIRQRAYELYVQRGGTDGLDADDWFRAETELLGRRSA